MSDWKTNWERAKAACPPGALLMMKEEESDFYCFYGEDAEKAAQVLGMSLTRQMGIPTVGVPYDKVEEAIAKLLRSGKSVALCDVLKEERRICH